MNSDGLYFTCQVGLLPEETFAVVHFSLHEALSELFTLRLQLSSPLPDIALQQQLMLPVILRVWCNGRLQRQVAGLVADIQRGQTGFRRTYYQLTVRPDLWRLTLRQDSRIYHRQSVPDIIESLLQRYRIRHEGRLYDPHAEREYVTQKRETEYQFLCRLAAEEGIGFWFECPAGGEPRLIYSDSRLGMTGTQVITYNPHPQNSLGGDLFSDVRLRATMVNQQVVQKDRNSLRPRYPLQHTATAETPLGNPESSSVYDSYGRFQDDGTGVPFTRYRLEALQSGAQTATATANGIALAPGSLFSIVSHPSDSLNQRWQTTATEYTGSQPQASEEDSSGGATTLSGTVSFIPAMTQWRPPFCHRPLADGPEVATVVGPEGEEIYTNADGCIRVHFHWNRYDKADDGASGWVRVAQGWNGGGYGFMAIPRIGQEVVVSYLDGDIDRPLVTGCTYNGLNHPPYALPEHKTRTVFRSKTHQGEGFNELSFEDAAGAEELYLHAQKDLAAKVENDARWQIARDRQQKIGRDGHTEIGRDRHLTVIGESRTRIDGDAHLQVGGSRQQQVDSDWVMKAGSEIHLQAASKVVLSAGTDLTLKAGGHFVRITPGGIFTSSGVSVGGGAAAEGTALALKLPNQPGTVAVPALLSAAQIEAFNQSAPYCEECETCRDGECDWDDGSGSGGGQESPGGGDSARNNPLIPGGGFGGGIGK